MVFSSLVFLFAFLPLVLAAYFAVRSLRARNGVLLCASLGFYAWGEGRFLAVLLCSIAVNHVFGLWIARRGGRRGSARGALAAALVANLLLLGFFKYGNFVSGGLALLSGGALPPLDEIHLPLGISFFTFQAITYVVDVYRGAAPVQSSLFRTALYISLFPQLIAGPIVRYRSIAGQLASRVVTREGFAEGVRRFSIGLGKKVLIANGVAVPADAIFAIPGHELSAGLAWLGVACYALQIYFDFSGYSDMAIGIGRLFGFRLPENFDYPYASRSIREFWRRWHITLSTWFRDYLFLPMGGTRGSGRRTAWNLLTVFALCGLWHGAALQYLVWGLFHGSFLAVERTGFARALARTPWPVQVAYTQLVLMVSWALFRADGFGHSAEILQAMAGLGTGTGVRHHVGMVLSGEAVLWIALGVLFATPWPQQLARRLAARGIGSPGALGAARLVGCAGVWLASASSLAAGTHDPFIYFRF